mmetsp:Transcript_3212/g.6850  ORF Transcript_3212/g.6850 Transcript_3212/m.6850 type:complete len:226 (-) Transcript_3212:72-749(-)
MLLQALQRQLGTIRIVLQFDLPHRSRNVLHSIVRLPSSTAISAGNAPGTNGLAGPRPPLIRSEFRPRFLPPALGTPSNGVLGLAVSFSGVSSGVFEEKGEGFEGVVGAGSPELVVSLGRVGELGHDSSSGVEDVDEDGLRVVVGVVVAFFGFVFFEEEGVGCLSAAFDVAIIFRKGLYLQRSRKLRVGHVFNFNRKGRFRRKNRSPQDRSTLVSNSGGLTDRYGK